MLKSFKLRISEIRERHLSAKKDKHRNLIHRCDSFKIKQGVEVDNEINHSKSADFHIISKLFHHNASSFISLMMPRNRTRSLCCTIFSATIYCLSLLRSVGSGQKLKRSPHLTTRTGLNFRRCLNHFSPTFENVDSNSSKNRRFYEGIFEEREIMKKNHRGPLVPRGMNGLQGNAAARGLNSSSNFDHVIRFLYEAKFLGLKF